MRPSRGLVVAAALGLIVAVSAAVAILLSGSAPPSPSPSLPSAVAVGPTVSTTATPPTHLPGATTGLPGPSATPGPSGGIVAKRIRIARLGIDLPIVEGDGVDAPMKKAAHYPDTAWPGGGSNIYIYGHAQKGMFLSLWDVAVGDDVLLDLVDGTTRTYTVTKIIPKAPWNAMELLDPTPTEQLTLQTSTSYLPTSPRFVVIAVPAAAG